MTIYLDNAASSCPKPPSVPEAVDRSLREYCANPGRGAHTMAVEAARAIHDSRSKAADLLGAGDSADVIFTQNATDALNMAMRGLLEPGDHVVTSGVEHNAVVRPLYSLQQQGVEVTIVESDNAGRVKADNLLEEVRGNTRLVVISHVSNVTAAVQPIGEIGVRLQERRVPFLVDAAQSAGALPLDISSMKVSMLACTGHKSLLGPQGIGLLYISPEIELRSSRQGGTGSTSEEPEQDLLSRPDRYESGTLNTPGIAGLGAGVDFIKERGIDEIARHKMSLTALLMQGLRDIAGVEIYGPPHGEERGPLVSFNVGDLASTEVAAKLDREYGIASRAGLHCAPGAHKAMGTLNRGVVRLSVGPFNDESDIGAALDAVGRIARDDGK